LGKKVAENILYSGKVGMHQTNRSLVVDIGFGKFEWALEELFGSRGVSLLQEWQAGSIWQCGVRFIDHKAVCAAKLRSALFEDLDIAEWLPGMIFGPSDWFVSLHLIIAMLCFTLSLLCLVPSCHCYVLFHLVPTVLCSTLPLVGCVPLGYCCDLLHLVNGVFCALLSLLCLVPSCHCYALFHVALAVFCCTLSLVACVPLGYCCDLLHLVTGVFCALLSLLCLVCCCIMCCLSISPRKTMRILHQISCAAGKFQAYIMVGWGWVASSMCWLCMRIMRVG